MLNTNTNAKLWQLLACCAICFIVGVLINHTSVLTVSVALIACVVFLGYYHVAKQNDCSAGTEDSAKIALLVILAIVGVIFTLLFAVDIGQILSKDW